MTARHTLYDSGEYLSTTQTWHTEDSAWKAQQISELLQKHALQPHRIGEVGCGAGMILWWLSQRDDLRETDFVGYDISPQAIELAQSQQSERLQFVREDLFLDSNAEFFDLLLVIDVIEHVPDFMGFLQTCKKKATMQIYHIPLDVHVSSVLRNSFIKHRYTIGHLHYFVADSALAALRDTGHEIVDFVFTDVGIGLFRQHPTLRRAIANVPRWLVSKVSVSIAARLFGGYSLLVLAR